MSQLRAGELTTTSGQVDPLWLTFDLAVDFMVWCPWATATENSSMFPNENWFSILSKYNILYTKCLVSPACQLFIKLVTEKWSCQGNHPIRHNWTMGQVHKSLKHLYHFQIEILFPLNAFKDDSLNYYHSEWIRLFTHNIYNINFPTEEKWQNN